MTAASATPTASPRDMGDICAARSKVDSIVGDHGDNAPGHDPRLPGAPRYDRTAMIELRKARGRWSADELDIDYIEEPLEIDADPAAGPIEIAVLDLPDFDAQEATVVRNLAAHHDRSLKLAHLARSAERFQAAIDQAAAEVAEEPEPIDLRESTADERHDTEIADMEGVVATIRKLASLRDDGLLTDAEFDAKMSDLLARV